MNTAQNEEWRDVPSYEGRYQVSDLGRVRGLISGKILRTQVQNSGYLILHFGLGRRGARKTMLVHRLVALAFHGPSDLHVNHKDGDKMNNSPSNLEWTSRSENMRHAVENGLANTHRNAVIGTPLNGGATLSFPSQCAVEQHFRGRNTGVVARCLAGKCGSAYGYVWSLA